MAEGLGNDAVKRRLQSAAGRRDNMLDFIVERLEKVRQVQLAESDLLYKREEWWRDLAWQEKGVWLPEPERWHQVAEDYRHAAEALARGDLARGANLLERAMETERAAIEAVPRGLGLNPDEDGEEGDALHGPDAMGSVADGEGCPATELPEGLKLAHEIERFNHTAREGRQIKVELHETPWWEEEEEEEEEGEAEG